MLNQKYVFSFWMYSGKQDDYVDYEMESKGLNKQDALNNLKRRFPRAKNFKFIKIK